MGAEIDTALGGISQCDDTTQAWFAAFALGLDQCPSPLILIGADLVVLHANASARMLLGERILYLQGGRLAARRAVENSALQAALLAVSDAPSILRLNDRQGRVVMVISLQSLSAGGMAGAMLMRTMHVRAPMVLSALTIAEIFGLSPAESRVAGELLAGFDTAAISLRLGIAPETVRTHLKQSMLKTATQSQAQLVGVLARGGLILKASDEDCKNL